MSEAPSHGSGKLVLQAGAVLLVGALLALLVWRIATRQEAEAKPNKPAPGFTLDRIDAPGNLSLASLRGKGVVLNFWASWCAPCRDEAPLLEAAWMRWRAKGLVVVGLDGSDDFRGDARAFMRKYGMTYPVAQDRHMSTVVSYGVTGYPETFFINRRGTLVGHVAGAINRKELAAGVRKALQ